MSSSNPHLIVKSNKLINAHLNGLTLTQLRFLEILVAQLDRKQSEFSKQKVYLNDFVKDIGTNNKNEYQRAREVTKSMMKHVIEIFDDDEGLKQRNIFHAVDFPKGKSFVEVVFHPHLRPYLLQLKEKFTSYDIRNTLHLNSVYAVQIYQLLKQYHKIGSREFELDALRKILGVEKKYKLYADFKKRVLLNSQRELASNCDITFTFKEKKQGRKVHAILFQIKSQQQQRDIVDAIPEVEVKDAKQQLKIILLEIGLTEQQIKDCFAKYSQEKIAQLVEYTRERFKEGQVANPTAYFFGLLKKEVVIKMHTAPKKKTALQKDEKYLDELALVETLKKEFEQLRKQQEQKLVKNATKEDMKRFESYVSNNLFLKKKLFVAGKLDINHPEFETWFGHQLASEHNHSFDQSFIGWAKESRGYHLKKVDGDTYRIISKQNSLF